MRRLAFVCALGSAALAAAPAGAEAGLLRAGVGKADVTPQTGYYLGGWTRADRTSHGQHTRLGTRALVLERNGRKVALVQVDLFMVPGGLVRHVAELTADRGFSEQNLLISASHTHSGPGGYANFATFNTAAPSLETATDPISYYLLLDPKPADRQLYTFLARQIAAAVRRADRNLGPAAAGWATAEIRGITQNRSVQAHLAGHGVFREYGEGSAADDPEGADHTIDAEVNVLRVDKLMRTGGRVRRVPVGGWSTFPDHGTVTKSSFEYYNQDHHGAALRVFEQKLRRAGRVPRRQAVVNVYGNSNEGDMSAGLERHGPAASEFVGRVEAAAMLRAWRGAGRSVSRTPELDLRWTRVCFCGQSVDGENVADYPMIGIPFLTGSEEERGPLFDVTGVAFEGRRNPLPVPGQGHKEGIPLNEEDVPKAVPLMTVRVGDRLIASIPGEATKEVGVRLEQAVGAAGGGGIARVIVSGLANEFIQYFTTPEEYDRQHYEGGSTLYGPLSGPFLIGQLAELARRMVAGQPAQPAHPFDPTNGVQLDGEPYGPGAAGGSAEAQPARRIRRLGHARFAWRGGEKGLDRPLGRAFVVVQRRTRRGWRRADTDLGLAMLWAVDESGRYEVSWEVPLRARRGVYRFVITAKRYRLVSRSFRVLAARSLRLRGVPAGPGRVAVMLEYPQPVRDRDLTYRPTRASGGAVRFRIGGRSVLVRRRRGTTFSVRAPAGRRVSVPGGRARDRHGNLAAAGIRLTP
jgi:neutral ceramidase